MSYRVLVCGGRDFKDRAWLVRELDARLNPTGHPLPLPGLHIIVGGARGADTMAEDWAWANWVPFTVFKAEWDKYGKRAGVLRNKQMLEEGKPDLVIAFPGGRGTAHMMSIARAAGVPVIDVGGTNV